MVTIIVVASIFLIKIHLTFKFILNKDSKLCADLSILLFTEATIEMFSLLFTLHLPLPFYVSSRTEPYTKSIGPNEQS